MSWLLLFLAFPLLFPWISKVIFHKTITWKEFLIHILIPIPFVAFVYWIGTYNSIADLEVWNGQIIDKKKEKVSCIHSYSCNCVTVSCGKDCTTTICQTCYDHPFDYVYKVYTDIKEVFKIKTEDRQGLITPKRFLDVTIGEPYSSTHTWKNYLKASPESLFSRDRELTKEEIEELPKEYPLTIYDYHRIDRVIFSGVNVYPEEKKEWNTYLSEKLKTLGPAKKANAVIVITKSGSPSYADNLKNLWLGGKKNDTVLVIGAPDYPNIAWARVISWTSKEEHKIFLRNSIQELKTADPKKVIDILSESIFNYFERRKIEEDFKYLEDVVVDPPLWAIITGILFGIISSLLLTVYLHFNDIFDDENPRRKYPWN